LAGVIAAVAVLAAIIAAAVVGRPGVVLGGRAPIRKIVLISIDTLRADHLSSYGYAKKTTPRIDAFAEDALLFERATAPAPWTSPSMAAMITGRYPLETEVYTNQNHLKPGMNSLADTLAKAGLATAWFNTNPVLMLGNSAFREGFSHVEPAARFTAKLPFSKLEPSLHSWLEQHAGGDFFLWLHSMDPHSPPTEGNPYHQDKQWNTYEGEIRLVDDAMGRLFDKLRALGIWDETLVIFTADHGEAFSEHMLPGHQNVIYDEVLHVPMIIRGPGMVKPGRTDEPVELIDLYRTIIELAQIEVPAGVRGESLVPILEGRATRRQQDFSFHSRYYLKALGQHYVAVRDREYKLIARVPFEVDPTVNMMQQRPTWSLDQPGTTFELYRWADDPREKVNLIFFGADPGVAERLKGALLAWRDRLVGRTTETTDTAIELDDKTREALRKLGYDGN
jgi:arylsulfatase A-like enzyme